MPGVGGQISRMAIFEVILLFLLAGVALTLLAPRLGLPWPAVLAVAGTGLAFIPGVPMMPLDPALALALFFSPVLLDAAYDTSPQALRENWRPVGSLVVVAVVITVAAVALVARAFVPDMPWAAAIALGAIVAPPDAAAATSVLQQVRLPRRLVLILEGESLLNDASVLLIYQAAVQAVSGGVTAWTLPLLALGAMAGILIGYGLARAYLAVAARFIGDSHMAAGVLLQFICTFGVWILAEKLKMSAVLTVVAYGMTIARLSRGRMGPRERRLNFAVWEVVVFALNVMAFLLTGLQIRVILGELQSPWRSAALALAVLAVCIVVRLAWVMLYTMTVREVRRRRGPKARASMRQLTPQTALVVGWAGMRGIVTLGAALALPASFPQRDLIQLVAFAVVLGTLGFQGLTLRPLIERLTLPADTSGDDEARARAEAAQAALDSLGEERGTKAGQVLAQQYERRLAEGGHAIEATALMQLQERAFIAERARIYDLHREGALGDDIYVELEEELDWAEAALGRPKKAG